MIDSKLRTKQRKDSKNRYVVKSGVDSSKRFESLDHDIIENQLLFEEENTKNYRYFVKQQTCMWVVFILTGIFTGSIGCAIDILIKLMCKLKFKLIITFMEADESIYQPLISWIGFNGLMVFFAAYMVTYWAPAAAGSGVPAVKCYLNGINSPNTLTFKTLAVKSITLNIILAGGIASGKEGPMVHIGSTVAAILSAGSLTIGKTTFDFFNYFRSDRDRREMVSVGCAAGVAAAFGAPIGGVLLSMEEGSSFWNHSLLWKMFFVSCISSFTVNLLLSAYNGSPGNFMHPSLIDLGKFNFTYESWELPIFVFIGFTGGLLGALWTELNYRIQRFRYKYITTNALKIVDAVSVAIITGLVSFMLTYCITDCISEQTWSMEETTNAYCKNKLKYNPMGSMWLQPPQASVKCLFHIPTGTFSMTYLFTFATSYFTLSCMALGLSLPNGNYTPALLAGAAWGRMLMGLIVRANPSLNVVNLGKYAVIGAVANLAGITRMTLCLTVIILETSDNISFSLPIIIAVISARLTGDFFNEGINFAQIKLMRAPFLLQAPPPLSLAIPSAEVMRSPAVCIRKLETVEFIMNKLRTTTHNGFPVIEDRNEENEVRNGRIIGLMLRRQLIFMLKNKLFADTEDCWKRVITENTYRDDYLTHNFIEDFQFTEQELLKKLNFWRFMNSAPCTVTHKTTLPRAHVLFRSIGIRHLPVIDDDNNVIGMITRKDLVKYKGGLVRCKLVLTVTKV